ncbi:MAG: ABC transporter permease [Actinobacteria bacterium]|nr:ABC transporter permease [Actinomycetota bacterium]
MSDVSSHPMDLARPGARWRGTLLGAAGFVPVWIVAALLLLLGLVLVPRSLSSASWSQIWPFTTFLAVASLGQMLVVLTGGIDLSVPSVITMVSTVLIGLSGGPDGRVLSSIALCLLLAGIVGASNGFFVAYLRLNPLVVTLAVGQIVLGLTAGYRLTIANESQVPATLADWASGRWLGITTVMWAGVAATIIVAIVLTRSTTGRRLRAVGANGEAAWISGIDVRRFTVGAYAAAGILYGVAGILIASFIRTPTLDVGAPYLLGPIAAVVIAGASLTGGVASSLSTWAAALALTFLSTLLRVTGLPSALQFVVFGVAIAAGMVISGDRIVGLVGRLTLRRDASTVGERPSVPGASR